MILPASYNGCPGSAGGFTRGPHAADCLCFISPQHLLSPISVQQFFHLHRLGPSCVDCGSVVVLQVPSAASQLTKVLAGLRHTFVVADATLPDMPLIYASEG